MIELTLLTLLNFIGDNFCQYRNVGHDNYKSLLLSYSDASEKFGPLEVKKIIDQINADGMKDMGKVMGIAAKNMLGKADGKIISSVVRKLLS